MNGFFVGIWGCIVVLKYQKEKRETSVESTYFGLSNHGAHIDLKKEINCSNICF